MSKEDQTTPGPVYDTQYLNSIQRRVDLTSELKNSSFGDFRHKQKTIPTKGFECAYLGQNSPGPGYYASSSLDASKVGNQLSINRNSQKYSMPKDVRFQEAKKTAGPSPATYSNTNEVSVKTTLKKNGAFSMPKQERKFDFAKFSSLHSQLVAKGYY